MSVESVRKPIALQDPEDMVLLREKLNQIAVGRRYVGDNQIDHMELDNGDDSGYRRPPSRGHFRLFLAGSDRPSTPPSSPQPRDVLRKQLRMKNHQQYQHRGSCNEDNSSDTASDEPLEGMCVDGVEISPLPYDDTTSGTPPMVSRPSVRLSVPEHLRTSSHSVLSKCPEGFRKRKSVHIDGKVLDVDGHETMVPLKRVSSQASVHNCTPTWDAASVDHDMDDEDTPPSDLSETSSDDASCS